MDKVVIRGENGRLYGRYGWDVFTDTRPEWVRLRQLVEQWAYKIYERKRCNQTGMTGWGQAVGWCEALEWVVSDMYPHGGWNASEVVERYAWYEMYARYTEDEYTDSSYSDIANFWDLVAVSGRMGELTGNGNDMWTSIDIVLDLLASLNPDIYDHHDMPRNMYDPYPK